jgi:hypothetical protein
MPKLLLYAACEKVIIDEQRNASLVNVILGLEAAQIQGTREAIPKNAIAPRPWTIFALWKPDAGDAGKEFTQFVQIMLPDGSEFKKVEVSFKMAESTAHQNKIEIMGFPVGQVGDILLNAWLESDRKRVGDIYSWAITISHPNRPVNMVTV